MGKKRIQKKNKTTEPIRLESHYQKLSTYFFNRNLRDYALFIFGIYTGRRISDIVALNVNDIAFVDDKGRFTIKNRLQRREKKTGKFIDIRLHDLARRALSKYLRQRKKAAYSIGDFLKEPLFKSQKKRKNGERRIRESSVWRILNTAGRKCGIDKIGTHSLRKTFGYILHRSGASIELIQKMLNHSSPEITLAYIGITQDDIDEAIFSMGWENLRVI